MIGRTAWIGIVLLLVGCGATRDEGEMGGPPTVREERWGAEAGKEEGEGREEVQRAQQERERAPRLRLWVAPEDSLDPIAGVEVRFLDLGPRGDYLLGSEWRQAPHPYMRDQAWVTVHTGPDGTAVMPPFPEMALIWARTPNGESWVHHVPSPDSDEATHDIGRRRTYPTEYVVLLERGRRFHVRCVHPGGRPGRDLPLVLGRRSPTHPSGFQRLSETFSDAAGVATFFVTEHAVSQWNPEDAEVRMEGMVVVEPFPLPEGEPWDRLMTWQLPSLAALDLLVIDGAGRPIPGPVPVEVSQPDVGRLEDRVVTGGVLRVEGLAPGRPVALAWTGRWGFLEREVVLPPTPGPSPARHTIVMERKEGPDPPYWDEDAVHLKARIVDADGEPVASSLVRVWADVESWGDGALHCWTDGSGNLVSNGAGLEAGKLVRVELQTDARRGWGGAGPRCAFVAGEQEGGIIDAGTLVLRQEPPDLEGRVVGEDGNPVAGAMVVLTAEHEAGRLGQGTWQLSRRDGTFSLYAETAVTGHLAVEGTVVPRVPVFARRDSRLGVEAWAPGYLPAEVHPLTPGSDVVLRRAAMIELEVLVDPRTTIAALTLLLEGPDGEVPECPELAYDADLVFPRPSHAFMELHPARRVSIWPPADVLGSRRMRWSLLRGDERVDVVVRVGDQEIARVKDVRIDRDDPRADPRLHPLDLRGLVRTLRVTVQGPEDPRDSNPGMIVLLGPGGFRVSDLERGSLVPRLPEDDRFLVSWRRRVWFGRLPEGDLLLTEEDFRPIDVRLLLPDPLRDVADRHRINLLLAWGPPEPPIRGAPQVDVSFGRDGTATARVPCAGPYRVLHVTVDVEGGRRSFEPAPPVTFVVPEDGADRPIILALDPDPILSVLPR
jgi:hypothetical protein